MGHKGRKRVKRAREHVDAEELRSDKAQIASARSSADPRRVPSGLTIEAEHPTAAISEDRAGLAKPDSDATVPQELIGEPLADQENQIFDELCEVQEYMAELLGRLADGGPPHAATNLMPRSMKKANTSGIVERSNAEATNPEVHPDRDCVAATVLTDLEPRPKPPEIQNLDAMRELANAQSHAAINTHHRNLLERRMLNNGAAGLACLIGSVVALICAPILGETMGIGRMAAVVACVYFLHVSFVSARAWFASR